ncbi:hypothetical protein LCGC14_1194420 [marine sediment metagenome]|uniref:Uncharacterized protein n=1 Tax=marine sediment metagenome TaxID=412755 RepID=A0A0F9M6A2_9ZZZZ
MWQDIKKLAKDIFGAPVCTAIYRPSITDRQGEKYIKRPPETPPGRSPKSVPMKKIERLELEGLDIEEVDHYEIRIPPRNSGEGHFHVTCEGRYSLESKVSELTSKGHTEMFVTAYKRVEEYKVCTKIKVTAKPI